MIDPAPMTIRRRFGILVRPKPTEPGLCTLNSETAVRVSSRIRRRILDGAAIFDKQYTTDDWGGTSEVLTKRVERERQLLQGVEASGLFRGRLGVVRVASCNPRDATIATHEVAGEPLGRWLRRKPLPLNPLLPWYLAGAWLRQFHLLPVPDTALERISEKDPQGLVEYCELRLRSLHELGYRWPDAATHRRLLAAVEQLENAKEHHWQRTVWVHADYAPGNLMWDGKTLTPIDFATARSGSPLDDATYLIHRLEMQRVYRPWLRLPLDAFRRSILRGLGHPTAGGSAAYQALMIRHLICRLHTYVWRPPSCLRQSIHNRWVRGEIRRRLLRLI